MKHTISIGVASAVLMMISMSGETRGERFEVNTGSTLRYLPSSSMDSITGDRSIGMGYIEVGVRVPELSLGPSLVPEFSLSYGGGQVKGTSFQRIGSVLTLDTFVASARLRRSLLDRLSGFASVGLGISQSSLELTASARPLQSDSSAALASASAGLEYDLVPRSVFTLALRVEAEYQAVGSMAFQATPMSEGEDRIDLKLRAASLGSLNTSGPGFRLGLVGRF